MKKLPIFLLICLLIGIVACKETEDYWTQYEQWRETNESWFIEQLGAKDEKGNPIYTKVVPSWDHSIYVLMKYYNDTSLNRDAQSPYQTSTVDVIYKGMLYDGTPFDSSYLRTDSIYRTQVKQNIKGWIIALEQMKVGDSCRVIIPQTLGYGSAESSRKCKFPLPLHSPFTIFELKLEDTFARLNKIKASFVLLRSRLFVYL